MRGCTGCLFCQVCSARLGCRILLLSGNLFSASRHSPYCGRGRLFPLCSKMGLWLFLNSFQAPGRNCLAGILHCLGRIGLCNMYCLGLRLSDRIFQPGRTRSRCTSCSLDGSGWLFALAPVAGSRRPAWQAKRCSGPFSLLSGSFSFLFFSFPGFFFQTDGIC